MSRSISAAAVREMLAQESGEAFLALLTLSNSGMETLRVVNNTQDVTSRSHVYAAFPFELNLPQDIAEEMGTAQLSISNVDRRLLEAIREVSSPMEAVIEIVTASAPDNVEVGPFTFDVSSVDYDENTITGTLTYEPVLGEPFPAGTFSPQNFPGLFGRT